MTPPTAPAPADDGRSEHSPLPWILSSGTLVISNQDDALAIVCNTLDLTGMAPHGIETMRANASLIVEAVNNHERLLAESATVAELRAALETAQLVSAVCTMTAAGLAGPAYDLISNSGFGSIAELMRHADQQYRSALATRRPQP